MPNIFINQAVSSKVKVACQLGLGFAPKNLVFVRFAMLELCFRFHCPRAPELNQAILGGYLDSMAFFLLYPCLCGQKIGRRGKKNKAYWTRLKGFSPWAPIEAYGSGNEWEIFDIYEFFETFEFFEILKFFNFLKIFEIFGNFCNF